MQDVQDVKAALAAGGLVAQTNGVPRGGSTRLLNVQGDVVITWGDSEDPDVLAKIQKKMDEGMVFFILEARGFGLLAPAETKIENVETQKDAILKTRTVKVLDADFDSLVVAGKAAAAHTPLVEDGAQKRPRAKSAKEVAAADTVAVQPRKGG